MKNLVYLGLILIMSCTQIEKGNFDYSFSAETIEGKKISFEQFKGNYLLIVNTASKCGLTPQYEGLQKLYEQYKDKGLVVLGFPCNQFMGQEPGNSEDIAEFCKLNYGVSFQMFNKVEVNGENASPLFKYLCKELPFKGFDKADEMGNKFDQFISKKFPKNYKGNSVKWNFTKFLISPQGKPLMRFEPPVKVREIEAYLSKILKK